MLFIESFGEVNLRKVRDIMIGVQKNDFFVDIETILQLKFEILNINEIFKVCLSLWALLTTVFFYFHEQILKEHYNMSEIVNI